MRQMRGWRCMSDKFLQQEVTVYAPEHARCPECGGAPTLLAFVPGTPGAVWCCPGHVPAGGTVVMRATPHGERSGRGEA